MSAKKKWLIGIGTVALIALCIFIGFVIWATCFFTTVDTLETDKLFLRDFENKLMVEFELADKITYTRCYPYAVDRIDSGSASLYDLIKVKSNQTKYYNKDTDRIFLTDTTGGYKSYFSFERTNGKFSLDLGRWRIEDGEYYVLLPLHIMKYLEGERKFILFADKSEIADYYREYGRGDFYTVREEEDKVIVSFPEEEREGFVTREFVIQIFEASGGAMPTVTVYSNICSE